MDKRWLEIKEVAQEYPWSARVIYNGLADGTFPVRAKRNGRKWLFDRKALDAYLETLPDSYQPSDGQEGTGK